MKKKNKLRRITPFLIGTCLFTLIACGSDDDDDSSVVAQPEEQRPVEGAYQVNLMPLNSNVVGEGVRGVALINVHDDTFEVETEMEGVSSTVHAQHIHAAAVCPTEADDTNGDGVVDVIEGVPSYGPILVPLDNNLASQSAGTFPFASGGNFTYEESTPLTQMIQALQQPDSDPNDAVVTLGADEDLDLDRRTIVIHGVAESTELPATVATIGDLEAYKSVPIACGVIERIPNPVPTPEIQNPPGEAPVVPGTEDGQGEPQEVL